jgi:hypothetical protein
MDLYLDTKDPESLGRAVTVNGVFWSTLGLTIVLLSLVGLPKMRGKLKIQLVFWISLVCIVGSTDSLVEILWFVSAVNTSINDLSLSFATACFVRIKFIDGGRGILMYRTCHWCEHVTLATLAAARVRGRAGDEDSSPVHRHRGRQ